MAHVLVVGSGGREHAIIWKLAQSPEIAKIYAAPGSYAIGRCDKTANIPLNINDFDAIADFCNANRVSLAVIGPEDPLANGIADILTSRGIAVFGPKRDAARLESDKCWAKEFMQRHSIPTARWRGFSMAAVAKDFIRGADINALVVKASGLAAGKGVIVANDREGACDAVDELQSKYGDSIVVEELLTGEEVSVLAFCDGNTVVAMLPTQDHKRIGDGDQGPNTGGMGAYCPCPLLNDKQMAFVRTEILERTIAGLRRENIEFKGVLYAGLMLTPTPKVLEFNCRFGDPETEVLMPLLETDLYAIMKACCDGHLDSTRIQWKRDTYCAGVVAASRGYPATSEKGRKITNLDRNDADVVFHCGTTTTTDGAEVVTNGGRVLIAVTLDARLHAAAHRATRACATIDFDGKQYRHDIAQKGIASAILKSGKLTYKASGVDVVAGNRLVDTIKPLTQSTARDGVMGAIGGFGALFDLKNRWRDPILVSGTDGVGTKLKIAQKMNQHDTIGIDLVAMCVNDVLAQGAEPLYFLDYFASGHLELGVTSDVVRGVAEGCRQAKCALIGGETAEMPTMYADGEYDLAGFCVGVVERTALLPRDDVTIDDVVIGLPSSGLHSNGYSLVRKVMEKSGLNYQNTAPFSDNGRSYGEEFLKPTKIYVETLLPAFATGKIKAFAHITGGGLIENIPRVLPENLAVSLDANKWAVPKILAWLAAKGGINKHELLRTFNCGLGGILIVSPQDVTDILKILKNPSGVVIGTIVPKTKKQVIVKNFTKVLSKQMTPFVTSLCVTQQKRVAVLISGSGTNLQALIDATVDNDNSHSRLVVVISNKKNVEGLKRAEKAHIPTHVVPSKGFNTREEYDAAIDVILADYRIDIVCLAGFMRILSGSFTKKWSGRLLNIHPSLLPAFKGLEPQKQALDAGVLYSGCTVHFVAEDVDGGAIIAQEVVPIARDDDVDSLREKIKSVEHKAYPRALELVASEKIRLNEDEKLVWQ